MGDNVASCKFQILSRGWPKKQVLIDMRGSLEGLNGHKLNKHLIKYTLSVCNGFKDLT